MTDLIVQIFIAAARCAAAWPMPERFTARKALYSLPGDCFEEWLPNDYFEEWIN